MSLRIGFSMAYWIALQSCIQEHSGLNPDGADGFWTIFSQLNVSIATLNVSFSFKNEIGVCSNWVFYKFSERHR